jgi:hypothetical protein
LNLAIDLDPIGFYPTYGLQCTTFLNFVLFAHHPQNDGETTGAKNSMEAMEPRLKGMEVGTLCRWAMCEPSAAPMIVKIIIF